MAYRVMLITVLLWTAGCQSQAPVPERPQTLNAEPQYEAVVASALVFDPPVAQDEPRLELTRADRQPGVVVGYEELTAEYFSIRMDDRQISNASGFRGSAGGFGSGIYDRYERRAVTERVGVRYR
jgi:hypothetical protein